MSGLVKGVKKVFKAIGDAVKKVIKTPIFKALLIGAAAIFTGGAALGAFGAIGSGSLASIGSAALSGGMSALGAVGSAISSGLSSVGSALGMGGSAAAEGAAAAGGGVIESGAGALAGGADAATSAAWGSGAGLGADTVAASGGSLADMAGAANAAGAAQGGFNLASVADGASSTFGPQSLSGLTGSPGALNLPASVADGAAGAAGSSNPLTSLWNFVKPETASSRMLWGQTLAGMGQGYFQNRAADQQRQFQREMSAVPDMRSQFQLKPNFNWALGGK